MYPHFLLPDKQFVMWSNVIRKTFIHQKQRRLWMDDISCRLRIRRDSTVHVDRYVIHIFIAFNVHFNMWYFLDTWFEICSIRTCQLPQGISDHRKANVLAVLECACEIFQVKNLDKATAENIASWCFIIKEAFTGYSSNNTNIFPFIMPVAMENFNCVVSW